MVRRFDPESSGGLTAHRDYDFDRQANDMRRLHAAVDHFDTAVTQGMIAMKQVASAFEAVGQAFTELTLSNQSLITGDAEELNPYPTEADVQYMAQTCGGGGEEQRASGNAVNLAPGAAVAAAAAATMDCAASVATTRMPEEANSQVRRLAKMFAEEVRRINEGPPFQAYNAGVHRDVVTRLRPVSEHLKYVDEYRHRRTEALIRYNKYKAEVEKVEKQYSKKGKPFCNSKTHKKSCEKRDEAWKEYQKQREKFNETFSMLMEVSDHAAAQIIHRYLALNHEYLQQLVVSMDRILPAMEEVYPLNSEYSTIQNSLLVEAVSNAKTPFVDHSKQRAGIPAAMAGEEGVAIDDAVGDREADQSSCSGVSSEAAKGLSLSRLPHDDDVPAHESAAMPTEMEKKEEEAVEKSPPTPAESTVTTATTTSATPAEPTPSMDPVQEVGAVSEDHGHMLTQPQRLVTHETVEEEPQVPGAVPA